MKFVIIGGVAAGMSAAAKIARTAKDPQITVYEKNGFFSYSACGLPYYVGGLNEDYRRMIARTPEEFAAQGIRLRPHCEAVSVEPERHAVTVRDLSSGQTFTDTYDRLLIATGAAPKWPGVPGEDLVGVHTLRSFEEGLFLKEYAASRGPGSVTVIGAGYIGLECADVFLQAGWKVRVVTNGDHVLPGFDPEMQDLAMEELCAVGAEMHPLENLIAFEGAGQLSQVRTDAGVYPSDLSIVAVGIRPNTDLLKGSGIALAQNGAVLTDSFLRTSVPDVYAAGDCATVKDRRTGGQRWQPLATTANKTGRIAGLNMAGGQEELFGAVGSAAVKICRLEFGRTGLGEEEARRAGLDAKAVTVRAYDHPTYYPGTTPLAVKVIYENGSRKLLGAQLCGQKGAALRTDIFAVAISAGMTTPELGMTDLVYAPPFSGVWDAVQLACNAAK